MRRSALLGALTALVSLALALAAAEGLLRLTGHGPWRPVAADAEEPTTHEPDPLLGWRARPGRYEIPAYVPGAPPTRMTILADGERVTREGVAADGPVLAFVGGSYTQGWAVSDEETLPWRVQQAFPQLDVRNYGTSGYGTFQSLLVTERLMASDDPPPIVVYGFIGHHEVRNVGHPAWLRMLSAHSRRGYVETPFVTLGEDGGLVRHPPTGHPRWPLRDTLATAAFLESLVAGLPGEARLAQAREVTERLMLEMAQRVRAPGGRFAVAILVATPETSAHYADFLARHGVEVRVCGGVLQRSELVPGEIHPNAGVHARWARCIGSLLVDWMPAGGEGDQPGISPATAAP